MLAALHTLITRTRRSKQRRALRRAAIESGMRLSRDGGTSDVSGQPADIGAMAARFEPSGTVQLVGGEVPLIWWNNAENFGDLLSPWLVGRMSGRGVRYAPACGPGYVAIGSVLKRVRPVSIVWGTGAFGTEQADKRTAAARYLSVRGPLTRSKVLDGGGNCPRCYGDPALALPFFFWPQVKPRYDCGLVVRWSERTWHQLQAPRGVKLINLGTADVQTIIRGILSCRRIASSSLHGLILADAYGIPNAWLRAEVGAGGSRPKGGEFKFYDYFLSVDKVRDSQMLPVVSGAPNVETLHFDARSIRFSYDAFFAACPFLQRRGEQVSQAAAAPVF